MRQTIFSILIISALLNAGCSMGQTGNAKNKYPDPPIATSKTVYPMKFTDAEFGTRPFFDALEAHRARAAGAPGTAEGA